MLTLHFTPLQTRLRALRLSVYAVRTRRAVSILLLLLVALHTTAPVLHAATTAPACGYAEIRGVITAADSGAPLPGVTIFADGQSRFLSAKADATGSYTLTVPYYLDTGPYTVTVQPDFASALPTIAYTAVPPTLTQVMSGETTLLDFALPRGGAIQGQIRAADTDVPLEGVFVSAEQPSSGSYISRQSTGTDAEGNYVLYGLTAGEYVLRYDTLNIFSVPATEVYETGYFGRANYPSQATVIPVTAPVSTTVNISVPLGSSIVGEIRRSDTNEVVSAMSVHAYLLDEDGQGHGEFITASNGSDFGTYYAGPLAPGNYLLFAQTRRTNGSGVSQFHNTWDLEMEWYKDVYSSAAATVVEIPDVGASQQISVDLMLSPGATITGVVTDADTGEAVVNIGVEPTPSPFQIYGVNVLFSYSSELVTDENGVYEIRGLLDGDYRVRVTPQFDGEYQSVGLFPSTSPTVTVAGTGIYPNINLSVRRSGGLSGTLTSEQGQPIADLEVSVVASDTGLVLVKTTSDSAGHYSFDNLAPGQYYVKYDRFVACGCYNNEYYVGEGNNENTLVTVAPGQITREIDSTLGCNAPPLVNPASSIFLPRLSTDVEQLHTQ